MNGEIVDLSPLSVEPFQIKEVLRIVLHSIVFQRALGECRIRETESDLFDLSYVRCDSAAVEQRVDEYAEAFSSALQRADGARRAQICVAFVERRSRPGAFGLFKTEEKVTWERWHIPLAVVDPAAEAEPGGGTVPAAPGARDEGEARRRRQRQLEVQLRERLEEIVTNASTRKDHIPPVDGLGGGGPAATGSGAGAGAASTAGGGASWFEVTSDASDSWSGLDVFKLGFGRIPRGF